jgi:hypothetical protein
LGGDTVDGSVVKSSRAAASGTNGSPKSFADRIKQAAGVAEEKRPTVPPHKRKRPPKKK